MIKWLPSVTIALTIFSMATAQKYCNTNYLTCRADGAPEAKVEVTTKCTQGSTTTCVGGVNPKCVYSLKTYSYICCYDQWDWSTAAGTPAAGSTLATLAPPATHSPRNAKPKCPAGSLAYGGGSQPMVCNMTNLAATACPFNYTCVKAQNVYDFYGTPATTADDVGAAETPNVCCLTASISSPSTVFTNAGLSPSIVPTAPKAGILSVYLPTPKVNVYLGDDRSAAAGQLTALTGTIINLYSNTINAAGTPPSTVRYHVLIFDSTTNKDCLIVGNIKGDGKPMITVPASVAPDGIAADGTKPAVTAGAVVYYDMTAKAYKWAQAYGTAPVVFGPANTAGHRFVVLVYQSATPVDFPTANVANDKTKIYLNTGLGGDFEPGRVVGAEGNFTTVTAFLQSKGALLGELMAGTYFMART